MNRRDFAANASLQTTFINQGIMRIQRELRCPAMEKSAIVTITAPYVGLVIPNDLLELQTLIPITADPDDVDKLVKTDIGTATRYASITQTPPKVYCRQGGVWVLGPSPNIGDQIRIDYWAELPALVNPTDTNIISVIAWDLIVYAALVQAAIYFKDSRKDDWEAQYGMILADTQDQSDQDDENSASVVQPCYAFPIDFQFDHY